MRARGSYTVEAALIMPIVLACLLLILNQTIDLYSQVKEHTTCSNWWQELESADSFRQIELMRHVTEKGGEDQEWK